MSSTQHCLFSGRSICPHRIPRAGKSCRGTDFLTIEYTPYFWQLIYPVNTIMFVSVNVMGNFVPKHVRFFDHINGRGVLKVNTKNENDVTR